MSEKKNEYITLPAVKVLASNVIEHEDLTWYMFHTGCLGVVEKRTAEGRMLCFVYPTDEKRNNALEIGNQRYEGMSEETEDVPKKEYERFLATYNATEHE